MRHRIRSRKTVYPWADWIARTGEFELRRGRDFPRTVPSYSMAQQIRNFVKSWQVGKVKVTINGDLLTVEITRSKECETCPR